MITLDHAQQLVQKALAAAAKAGVAITVAITDEHGTLVALSRADGALVVSPIFSTAKAFTSATLGLPTSALAGFATEGKPYANLTALDPKFTTIAGGLPIMQDGQLIGGIGIGGSQDPAQDEQFAAAALA